MHQALFIVVVVAVIWLATLSTQLYAALGIVACGLVIWAVIRMFRVLLTAALLLGAAYLLFTHGGI